MTVTRFPRVCWKGFVFPKLNGGTLYFQSSLDFDIFGPNLPGMQSKYLIFLKFSVINSSVVYGYGYDPFETRALQRYSDNPVFCSK